MTEVIEEVLDRNPGPGEARRSAHNLGIYADGIHPGIIARYAYFFPNPYNFSPVLTNTLPPATAIDACALSLFVSAPFHKIFDSLAEQTHTSPFSLMQ